MHFDDRKILHFQCLALFQKPSVAVEFVVPKGSLSVRVVKLYFIPVLFISLLCI